MRPYLAKTCLTPTRTSEVDSHALTSKTRRTIRRAFKKSARRMSRLIVAEGLAVAGVEEEASQALYEHEMHEQDRLNSELAEAEEDRRNELYEQQYLDDYDYGSDDRDVDYDMHHLGGCGICGLDDKVCSFLSGSLTPPAETAPAYDWSADPDFQGQVLP
jgi:hypothetical protein